VAHFPTLFREERGKGWGNAAESYGRISKANLRIRGNLLALSLSKYCNVSAPAAARMVCGPGLIPHPSCVNMETTPERSALWRAPEELVIEKWWRWEIP
jgi:hypothetical protein